MFIVYPNVKHDINMIKLDNIISLVLIGTISPYPTEVIDAIEQ